MTIHEKARKIWKDPVISKLISMGIPVAGGALILLLSDLNWSDAIKNPWFWIIGITSLLICGVIVYYILNFIILGEEIKREPLSENIEDSTEKNIVLIDDNTESTIEVDTLDSEEEIHKSYNWLDSDILFSQCIAQTFPGDRETVWYDSSVAVQRLNLFFENTRKQEPTGDAVWWRRGNQSFPIKNAEILDIDKIFLGIHSLKFEDKKGTIKTYGKYDKNKPTTKRKWCF